MSDAAYIALGTKEEHEDSLDAPSFTQPATRLPPHAPKESSLFRPRYLIAAALAIVAVATLALLQLQPSLPGFSRDSPLVPVHLPTILVGPRKYPDLYFHQCSEADYLDDLTNIEIRANGTSRTPLDQSNVPKNTLPPFAFSFDFDRKCPQPHIFSPEEACDLISSFGGLFFTGDSFVRHVYVALLMLLRGRLDGGILHMDENVDCVGEQLFLEKKTCANRIAHTTTEQQPLCGGAVKLSYEPTYKPEHFPSKPWFEYLHSLPTAQRRQSPIFIQGQGLHFAYNLTDVRSMWFPTLFHIHAHSFPRPVSFVTGSHHPGANQPEKYVDTQGPAVVEQYNHDLKELLEELSPGEAGTGGTSFVPFWGMSNGAYSFDGVHYSYQVNMEKVQLLLNLLDITWGEIARRKGLVEPV